MTRAVRILSRFAVAALLLVLTTACIESLCTTNADCDRGRVCQPLSGACVRSECATHEDCAAGLVCGDHRCVPGCIEDADCGDGGRCVGHQCAGEPPDCGCDAAPRFCLPDVNPPSESFGQNVCIPTDTPEGVVLFFGSVGCRICVVQFEALVALEDELRLDGRPARTAFVQLADQPVSEDAVRHFFAGLSVPVLQDNSLTQVWDTYAAGWYHLILIDAAGCRALHRDPLTDDDLTPAGRAALVSEWTTAMEASCDPPQAE